MHRFSRPLAVGLLVLSSGLAAAAESKPRRPRVLADLPPPIYAATLGPITASPSTISFSATDPDVVPNVSGNSAATVSWSITSGGSPSQTWTLTVQAPVSSFSSCSTVPVSAVTVRCASASVTGGGGSGSCRPAFTRSTSPQTVASGKEGNNHTVTINFNLADTWKCVAAQSPACTSTITYTVNAP